MFIYYIFIYFLCVSLMNLQSEFISVTVAITWIAGCGEGGLVHVCGAWCWSSDTR